MGEEEAGWTGAPVTELVALGRFWTRASGGGWCKMRQDKADTFPATSWSPYSHGPPGTSESHPLGYYAA